MQYMIISVVIPVFNERDTILEIIKRVKQTSLAQEIIVLDDGSTDGTTEILKELKPSKEIHAYFHNENLGKGIAVRNSINHAKGNVIIIQDSDLEYNPCDFPILLKPIQDGLADVVYGSRFLSKRGQQLIFWSLAANKILTFFTNMLYHSKLSDMETGYKVFKSSTEFNIDKMLSETDSLMYENKEMMKNRSSKRE